MSWFAKIVDFNKENRAVNLLFTEDSTGKTYANQYVIPLGAPATWIGDLVAQIIKQLSAQDTAATTIPSIGGTVIPTPEPIVVPDPDAKMKDDFLAEWTQLRQMQVAINHGIKSASDLDYIALLSKVTSDFAAKQSILLPFMVDGR